MSNTGAEGIASITELRFASYDTYENVDNIRIPSPAFYENGSPKLAAFSSKGLIFWVSVIAHIHIRPCLVFLSRNLDSNIELPTFPPAACRAQQLPSCNSRVDLASELSLSRGYRLVLGRLLGVQVLLELDAELLAQGLELGQVLLVLLLVLDLGLDACCVHAGGSANRQFLCVNALWFRFLPYPRRCARR